MSLGRGRLTFCDAAATRCKLDLNPVSQTPMPSSVRGMGRISRNRRRGVTAMMTVAMLVGLGAAASAQDPGSLPDDAPVQVLDENQQATVDKAQSDPGAACQEQVNQSAAGGTVNNPPISGAVCDNKFTPVAKDGEPIGWTQVGGSVHPAADPAKYKEQDSPTPATVDFYTVDLDNVDNGFAGGAACKEDPPEGVRGDALTVYLRTCLRVPVIYRFRSADFPQWQEVYRGRSRGFVGAITALGNRGRFLAVGGDGCYPRREDRGDSNSNCAEINLPAEDAEDNIGGTARVWLLNDRDADWEEREPPQSASGIRMRAMTAADASPRVTDCGASRECAFVGGLKQIWTWRDDAFSAQPLRPDDNPAESGNQWRINPNDGTDNSGRANWRYRVRQIRFRPPGNGTGASAVTSGCCPSGGAATLNYSAATRRWSAAAVVAATGAPDSYYGLAFATPNASGTSSGASYAAAPGGPYHRGEPASEVVPSQQAVTPQYRAPLPRSVRLVALDGDFQGHQGHLAADWKQTDALADWAVGGMRAPGARPSFYGARAVAYTTTTHGYVLSGSFPTPDGPNPLRCPEGADSNAIFGLNPFPPDQNAATKCEPDPDAAKQMKSDHLYALSSYFLNSFGFAGDSGIAWAAGDRGALVRLGGEGTSSSLQTEKAAKLGARRRGEFPDKGAYANKAPPLTAEAGTVPALASRPSDSRLKPGLIPYGSPDPHPAVGRGESVAAIAMSRDGSEGWAVGPRMTLHHFDGARWTRCGTDTVEGAIEPDDACRSLRQFRIANSAVNLDTIVRVPLEYDSDPENDDEFEVWAYGSGKVFRYRNGRWSQDAEQAAELNTDAITDVAFASPDDAWAVANGGNFLTIYRRLGGHWVHCFGGNIRDPRCDDPQGRFPFDNFIPNTTHLAAAGQRLYLYGNRSAGDSTTGQANSGSSGSYPFVLYKDLDESWRPAYDPRPSDDDPGKPDEEGVIRSLSVARTADGSYIGWAVGHFKRTAVGAGALAATASQPNETPLLRGSADGKQWSPVEADPVAKQYLLPAPFKNNNLAAAGSTMQVVAMPGPKGLGGAVAVSQTGGGGGVTPAVKFNPERDRWEVFSTPFVQLWGGADSQQQANPEVIAPDGTGGIWMSVSGVFFTQAAGSWFYRYSESRPESVFEESPHPVREQITGGAAGGDGSFWVSTNGSFVYRYDRVTGWDRIQIPGWNGPGQVSTVNYPAYALSVGPDGDGVVVGKNGRVANISRGGAVLDRVAGGVLCSELPPESPDRLEGCGTGRDLRSAAIAPDGSALIGGDSRALLWRPPGGEFRSVTPPGTAVFATISGIAYPQPDKAWLVTSTGEIYSGRLVNDGSGGVTWSWTREGVDENGNSITRGIEGRTNALNAIALGADGEGFAVGQQGVIVERGDDGWRRLKSGQLDNLRSVTLGSGGKGALIGGDSGLVLTLQGHDFVPARYADTFDRITAAGFGGDHNARIVGVALLSGFEAAEAEAWAVSQIPPSFANTDRVPEPGAILHYASEPGDPLLDGGNERSEPLPDTPAGGNALSFAAFGRSECQSPNRFGSAVLACPELTGSNQANDQVATMVREQVLTGPDSADFALFTGDVGDIAGSRRKNKLTTGVDRVGDHSIDPSVIHQRWAELIARSLHEAGVPLYGAIGGRDLSSTEACDPFPSNCVNTNQTKLGPNLAWRSAMAGMPAPWGNGPPARANEFSFEPLKGTVFASTQANAESQADDVMREGQSAFNAKQDELEQEHGGTVNGVQEQVDESQEEVNGQMPEVGGMRPTLQRLPRVLPTQRVPPARVPRGAQTHYALDVKRGGAPVARLVVLDSSFKSLAASDPQQRPAEEQIQWLVDVLCVKGRAADTPAADCTREPGQRAIVLNNTPTYAYGTSGALTDTNTAEGSTLETLFLQHGVDVVVQGRLGWNALAYLRGVNGAPINHFPEPGGAYPEEEPEPLPGGDKPLPMVIASTAGGKFGPSGQDPGSAAQGFWRGYTVVRLEEGGQVRVIQRPVFDWIGVRGDAHSLRPRQRMTIQGFGREPAGVDVPLRYDEISSAAITHCYDLLLADQAKPWEPLKAADASEKQLAGQGEGCGNRSSASGPVLQSTDGPEDEAGPCEPYVCLKADVGKIDDQSGMVRAGSGEQERTFAMAMLSVGGKAATWPLVFEPRPSFSQPRVPPPPPPPPPPAPPPPANPPSTGISNLNLPAPPALPTLPLSAEMQPPAPPIPPPPPGAASAAPLNLFLSTPGINIAPQSTVIPPPAPPIQPAPPGGARKEARQRQAAAQKSGSEAVSDEAESGRGAPGGGDLADGPASPGGVDMTRYENNFTAAVHREQPSAWTRNLQWGGGMTLMALVLAFGWMTVRPTPRRRPPHVPAPAWSRADYRRRRQ